MGVVDHLTDVIYVTAIRANRASCCSASQHRQHLSTSKKRVNDTLLGKCPFLLKTSSYATSCPSFLHFVAMDSCSTTPWMVNCEGQGWVLLQCRLDSIH